MSRSTGNAGRRRFSAAHKANILRQHLVDKKPISDVCDKEGIQPSAFYSWQTQPFLGYSVTLKCRIPLVP